MFDAASLIKDGTIKIDKVNIQCHGVAFGTRTYTHKDGKNARNVIIFGVDLNDKDKKYSSLVLGKGSIKLNNTTIQADELKTNCMVPNERFVLSVHYNSGNSYLFINGINLKQKTLKLRLINCVWEIFQKN